MLAALRVIYMGGGESSRTCGLSPWYPGAGVVGAGESSWLTRCWPGVSGMSFDPASSRIGGALAKKNDRVMRSLSFEVCYSGW